MRFVLALEWSTRQLSAALSRDGMPYAETVRQVDRFHAPTALAMVQSLLRDAESSLEQVEALLVGRGPGNYSGVRQAFAWSAGAAAPGGLGVEAVSSARALGERFLRETEAETVTVLGDARRGHWWGGDVRREKETVWTLRRPEEWIETLQGARVVSSEPERLSGIANLEGAHPTAMDLVRARGREALAPLYLHPPV